jgi:gamma-glutamylcyclotransferase (GGCT)/AIG2-like uncharacterized protein YtfP
MVGIGLGWLMKIMSELNAKFPGLMRVFVYGTLKPGEANYKRYCADRVVDAKRAYAFGKLFALGVGYPAMTLGNSQVHGYLLYFADSKILIQLDELEGYQPSRQIAKNLYNRHQIETYDFEGSSFGLAWVYLMTPAQVSQMGGIPLDDGWWTGFRSYEL